MQPVLEVYAPDGFALWPVADVRHGFGYLMLGGRLSRAEIGLAMLRLADANNPEPDTERPAEPGRLLDGLLNAEIVFLPGGLRVTDDTTGITFQPGCCHGLEDWRDWHAVLDGDCRVDCGHSPSPLVQRCGDRIRLTVDTERLDSPVLEPTVREVRRLLLGVERDLNDFLAVTLDWESEQLPEQAVLIAAVLARALGLPEL